MNEGQLQTFDAGSVYLLKGGTLNDIVGKIIKEILTNDTEITTSQPGPNKVQLALAVKFPAGPATGNHVLTIQEGAYVWEQILDCDAEEEGD